MSHILQVTLTSDKKKYGINIVTFKNGISKKE